MILYFWHKGLFFFDVPKESRVMLILRSIMYAMSYTLFVRSMSFLNPVVAIICQQSGVLVAENIIRFMLRQYMVANVIAVKFSLTVVLLLPGWVPETCLVSPPLVELKKELHQECKFYHNYSNYALLTPFALFDRITYSY